MKSIASIFFLLLVVSTSLISCNSKPKNRQKPETNNMDSLSLNDAWARPAVKGGNSAVYLKIFNGTDITDTLLSITTGAAPMAQVHESYQENGLEGMRRAGKQAIKPDSVLVLQPGGFHIMLMQVNHDLAKGDSLQLTLHFSTAGAHRIMVPVKLSNKP